MLSASSPLHSPAYPCAPAGLFCCLLFAVAPSSLLCAVRRLLPLCAPDQRGMDPNICRELGAHFHPGLAPPQGGIQQRRKVLRWQLSRVPHTQQSRCVAQAVCQWFVCQVSERVQRARFEQTVGGSQQLIQPACCVWLLVVARC